MVDVCVVCKVNVLKCNKRFGGTIKDLKMNDREEMIMDENSNDSTESNAKIPSPRKRGSFAKESNYNYCKDIESSEPSTNRYRFKRFKFIVNKRNSNLKTFKTFKTLFIIRQCSLPEM